MAKDFYTNEACAINKWIYDRDLYHKQVRTHFKNNKKFIAIDVTKSDQWADDLMLFFDRNELNYSTVKPIKDIHTNKRNSSELINKKLLTKYFSLIDKIVQ